MVRALERFSGAKQCGFGGGAWSPSAAELAAADIHARILPDYRFLAQRFEGCKRQGLRRKV
ncbi:hypothetical protein [Thauera phenolivorans]|uniref:hypothetical protein n=1 Tax=Thauera phenolivorans TaxID=1792543 RepID=UPI0013013BE4|nr:hypothetical protein [Thauera phenolivorans]